MGILHQLLAHPLTRGLSVDDPNTTALRRKIIQDKVFLRRIYEEWYARVASRITGAKDVLELGSGAGFFDQFVPHVITSEVFETPGVKLIADGCQMPLPDASLDAIVMTDVLHHIPDVGRFFEEATRCVRPGGKLVMIEPWYTPWSYWVYTHLHHEPFVPDAADWTIPSTGPLSGANGAIPWMLLVRDRAEFERRFPHWQIVSVQPIMPLCYLLSGGVSLRSLLPGWAYPIVRALERLLPQSKTAMFAQIELHLR